MPPQTPDASVEAGRPALDLEVSIDTLQSRAHQFRVRHDEVKRAITDIPAYPYDTFGNLFHLERLLTGERRKLARLAGGLPIADIAAADGDLAFFLEAQGFDVHIIDNAAINCNGLRMARTVASAIKSRVAIHDIDLDGHFQLPQTEYGLVFFLGVLYHLKNPFYALEQLARQCRHMALSTRVAQFARPLVAPPPPVERVPSLLEDVVDRLLPRPPPPPPPGPPGMARIGGLPLAYLVDERECNDDPTNYWIFTREGLHRLLHRTGWEILDTLAVGNTERSDPASATGDERSFCLARSRVFGRS
jgi:tRNA (mo5U34)-methyltransferase